MRLLVVLSALLLGPLLGGLLNGVDRRLTAILQGRVGPPLLQPFYDCIKLLGKERKYGSAWQVVCAYIYTIMSALGLVMLALQQDLLAIFFVISVGSVFFVVGAMSTHSPYSDVGGHRELIQMLAYEPLLILVILGIYMSVGSFRVSDMLAFKEPLALRLPLMLIVLEIIIGIRMRKSPFDISASEHAHQEIVRGVLTEYSGVYLMLIDIAHWYELVLLLGLVALFWATNIVGAIVLALAMLLLEILVDNITARLTWDWMLKFSIAAGIVLGAINIVAISI